MHLTNVPASKMLTQQQQRQAAASGSSFMEKPSIGSLFVPTRMQQPRSEAATTARIALPGLRQPTSASDDLGLIMGPHFNQPAMAAAPSTVKPKLRLSWAGSGIYFWWQLGAVQYLMQHFQLSKVPMVGASGGGLAAMLATCEVDPEEVMESAYKLSKEHGIWERPLGLMGTWGYVIEQWLHELLPADAAERCRDQVGIVVTQLPFCNQVSISDFSDKSDLINVAMASAHVPLFLDWKMSRPCRGVQCVDGSFPDFFINDNCEMLKCGGNAVMFDYFHDTNIVRNGRMDMLELKKFSEFKKIILLGYRFAQRLHEQGEFERFDVRGVSKQLII